MLYAMRIYDYEIGERPESYLGRSILGSLREPPNALSFCTLGLACKEA